LANELSCLSGLDNCSGQEKIKQAHKENQKKHLKHKVLNLPALSFFAIFAPLREHCIWFFRHYVINKKAAGAR
jgi:hypothetical protein